MKLKTPVTFIFGLAAMILVTSTAYAVSDKQRAEIEARIQKTGEVCLDTDTDCGAAEIVASVARSGEEVYNAACLACHMTGAGNAPILGDTVAWADRLAKGNDALYVSGIKGVPGTSMMARGACMDCSDDEIIAAVDYMIINSK